MALAQSAGPYTSTPGKGSLERAELTLRVSARTVWPWLASLDTRRQPTSPVAPARSMWCSVPQSCACTPRALAGQLACPTAAHQQPRGAACAWSGREWCRVHQFSVQCTMQRCSRRQSISPRGTGERWLPAWLPCMARAPGMA